MHYFFIFLFVVQTVQAKVDVSGLAVNAQKKQDEKKLSVAGPQKTKKESAKIGADGQDVETLKESLKGVNLILTSQKNPPNKVDLMLKKAFLHVSIVRAMGRNRTNASQLTDEDKKNLTVAKKMLVQLLGPAGKQTDAGKASIYYLMGLIAYEYDDYKDQQKNFIESLKLDPNGSQSGSLALMVAEQYFDEEDFNNALIYYNNYLNVMNDKQKDLALYKSAWCYISMDQNEKAETELLKVVQGRRKSGFQKDSLRDLAFIAVRHRDELGIIRYGREKIAHEEDRNDFYSLSLRYFFQAQSKQPLDNLIKIVLKSEKKIEARLEILGHKVHELRADYLNPQLLIYDQSIKAELDKSKANLDSPELETFKKTFQTDMEFVIFQITEAYQGKSSTDLSMPKSKMAALLEKHILLYDGFFPESKNKIIVYQILSDLCVDFKVLACVTQVYSKIRTYKPEDRSWQDIRLKLRAMQLVLADEAYEKDPEKNETLLLQTFNEFKKDYPTHELVLKGLKKTLQIYAKRSDLSSSEDNYEEIYKREKTPENLYNWAVVLFKQEKYSEVLPIIMGEYAGDSKLDQLRIETNLKLADKESHAGDYEKYEAHIVEILKINKDDKKGILIYTDWLSRAINAKKNGIERAIAIYSNIPPTTRANPAFTPFLVRFADYFVINGQFERLQKLNFNYMEKSQDPSLAYYKLVDYLAYDGSSLPKWTDLLRSLDVDRKNYLLGLMVLLRPDVALEFFRSGKDKDRADIAPEMYLIALRMFNKSEQFDLEPIDRKILGALDKAVKKTSVEEPAILKEMRAVKFPNSKMSIKRYNNVVEALVVSVKKIRQKTIKVFETATMEQQMMIAPEAEALENKTAQAIAEAPLPAALSAEQKVEYQTGMAEVAKEFSDQAEEFKKLHLALVSKTNESEKQRLAEMLPSIDLLKWPWPKSEIVKKSLILQKASDMQAHFYLDAALATKTITEDDYWQTRVGLLGLSQNSDVMRLYIKQELTQLKRDSLIQKWRGLASEAK